MENVKFPERRTPASAKRDREFLSVLDRMFQANETITARSVSRSVSGFSAATSITRDEWRSAQLAEWIKRQSHLRKIQEQSDKQSKPKLLSKLEQKEKRIQELEQTVDILLSSHRAMIHAVGEVGGMKAWLKFYEKHQAIQEKLSDMGAIPSSVVSISSNSDKSR